MPVVLQKRILKEFHQGHPGIGRMKALMRSYNYWPNMDKDIEQVVKTCKGCQLAAKASPVKFTPWPKTDVPWTRLHIDYAGLMNGNYHLIVVDVYSKWPEIFKCKRPTATVTKYFLTELFECFGVPVFLKSYKNGKEFWQDGIITQRVGKMLYMVKSKKLMHKRHLNQLRRFTEEISKDNEEPMEVLYDLFDIPIPPLPETVVQKRTSKRKRNRVERLSPDPKRKKILIPEELISRGNCWVGNFPPLLKVNCSACGVDEWMI